MIYSYNFLIENYQSYDKKAVKKLVIISGRCKDRKITRDSKKELFLMLTAVTIKNIENFFKYCKSKGYRDLIHERDDLVSESYMVMDKCIEKFNISNKTIFYWYYNRALTNRMLRIIENTYYKSRSIGRVPEGSEYFVETLQLVEIDIDFSELMLENFNITHNERRIIETKLNKGSIRDLISEELQITQNEYYKIVSRLKKKFKYEYDK